MLKKGLKERINAFRAIMLWLNTGRFIKSSGLTPFALEIALGVCRRHIFLLYFIKKLIPKELPTELSVVLEMGLYQMFFMRVPDYATINTCIELVRSFSDMKDLVDTKKINPSSVKLVNGILRNARKIGFPDFPPQKVRRISIENSVPEWIIRRWFDFYGIEKTTKIAKGTLQIPREWLRVNVQKVEMKIFQEKMHLENAETKFNRFILVPPEVKLKDLLSSDSFKKGEFSFQNPAAFPVVNLLNLKPEITLWDACASPGGKSALISEIEPSIKIFATDLYDNRVEKMRDLTSRLKLKNIQIATENVLNPSKALKTKKFDRILLDVPCSNLGVIHRRPESVYRLTKESLKELSKQQLNLLQKASQQLKDNGIIVYATCSPDAEETTKVIDHFLKENPVFERMGEGIYTQENDNSLDGFFAQALRRKS